MSLNIFTVVLCTHSAQWRFLVTRRDSTVSLPFDSFLITEVAESGIPAAHFYYTWTLKRWQARREEVKRRWWRRESTEAGSLSCLLHLSFYGQQQGSSLPLMTLTAYFTALHSLFFYYSLHSWLTKWTLYMRVCVCNRLRFNVFPSCRVLLTHSDTVGDKCPLSWHRNTSL